LTRSNHDSGISEEAIEKLWKAGKGEEMEEEEDEEEEEGEMSSLAIQLSHLLPPMISSRVSGIAVLAVPTSTSSIPSLSFRPPSLVLADPTVAAVVMGVQAYRLTHSCTIIFTRRAAGRVTSPASSKGIVGTLHTQSGPVADKLPIQRGRCEEEEEYEEGQAGFTSSVVRRRRRREEEAEEEEEEGQAGYLIDGDQHQCRLTGGGFEVQSQGQAVVTRSPEVSMEEVEGRRVQIGQQDLVVEGEREDVEMAKRELGGYKTGGVSMDVDERNSLGREGACLRGSDKGGAPSEDLAAAQGVIHSGAIIFVFG
jgi:hypothetical protein